MYGVALVKATICFFEIWTSVNQLSIRISHPAKNANKLGQVWQNIVVKSDIHGQKENGLELFRSRRHFEEINPLSLN